MSETKFKTKNSSSAFWSGFSKQTIDFQHALGELVDNALSATLPKPSGIGKQTGIIEITLRELDDLDVRVQVADAGIGVAWEDLTGEENIFNLGFRPQTRGHMNEHGFGLKNALALMTSGFQKDFLFLTKPVNTGKIYGVEGPIKEEMVAREYNESSWQEDLSLLKNVSSGTKAIVTVKREYFKTIYTRAGNFDSLVERLGEHLGVMYSHFIATDNEIYVRYRAKNASDWTEKKVPSIPTPFLQNSAETKKEAKISLSFDGKTISVPYTCGILDPVIKDPRANMGWPYPLKIHFQGSNARCGITYTVRNRVLKTGVFRDIWPEHAGDVSFNNFLGELKLEEEFATTNNKTDLDPHSDVWPLLVQKIKDEFPPEKTTKKASEEGLRKQISKQIAQVHSLSGANVPKKKKVWDGDAEIDVYYEVNGEIFFMELKIVPAQVMDVYQLIMYWDGLVEEGKHPKKCFIVAPSIHASVHKAIGHVNGLHDKNGNQYVIESQKVEDWISL